MPKYTEKLDVKRIWSQVPTATYYELIELSKRFGLPASKLVSISVVVGIKSIMRMAYPEELITPEMMDKLHIVSEDMVKPK
jgi:hypothetical protein